MHYYIYNSDEAPSGIALIISFEEFKIEKPVGGGESKYYPQNYTVHHNEVTYLGGSGPEDILYGGVYKIDILDEQRLIKRIFNVN